MRRFLFAAVLGWMTITNVGCILPAYSGDPQVRVRQLMHASEDMRTINDEWARFWFVDQPSHMKPLRVHGGVN